MTIRALLLLQGGCGRNDAFPPSLTPAGHYRIHHSTAITIIDGPSINILLNRLFHGHPARHGGLLIRGVCSTIVRVDQAQSQYDPARSSRHPTRPPPRVRVINVRDENLFRVRRI
jgi:hypothetical protein